MVTNVDVVERVGDGFDEAAVAAAMQYVFEPAEVDGKPGAIAVETTIGFVIEEKPVEEPPPPVHKSDDNAVGPPNHGGYMSDPITFEGVALERGTRKKLAGVIVSIVELGLDAVTDERGEFFFHGVGEGTYRILAVEDKSDRLLRTVTLAKREKIELRLWMLERLTPAKVPRRIWMVAALPRTPTGKVQRGELARLWSDAHR